jgi:hypothetical protein
MSSTNQLHASKHSLPGKIRDEIRRTAALRLYSYICSQSQLKLRCQLTKIQDMYHGNETHISQIDQIVNGRPPFDELYNKSIEVITNGTTTNTNATVLTLKRELYRSKFPYVAGKEITRKILETNSFQGHNLVSGRALLESAKLTLKTIRKAVAISKNYVDSNGTPKHSGHTIDDVLESILDEMYTVLNGKNRIEEANSSPSNLNNSPCDPTWFFQGWFVFVLYGPLQSPNQRLSILEEGENFYDNNISSGLSFFWKQQRTTKNKVIEDTDLNSSLATTSSDESSNTKANLLHRQDKLCKASNQISTIALVIKKRELLMSQTTVASDRAKRYCPIADPNNEYWKQLDKYERELVPLSKIINDLLNNVNKNNHSPAQKKPVLNYQIT